MISDLGCVETIEETTTLVDAAGGAGVAVRADHGDPETRSALSSTGSPRTRTRRLDVLVDSVWGGDPLTDWEHPL
ncbi:hypothetical protein [Actinomadura sp. NTSP31]|uniref:hypothetical protein n=1 Tax=Actinomadura sp. NTSP31 TaxID=1735447 RepID=UPI0035BEDE56